MVKLEGISRQQIDQSGYFFLASTKQQIILVWRCACVLCTWNVIQWGSVFWSKMRIPFSSCLRTVRLTKMWRYINTVILSDLLHLLFPHLDRQRATTEAVSVWKAFWSPGCKAVFTVGFACFLPKKKIHLFLF